MAGRRADRHQSSTACRSGGSAWARPPANSRKGGRFSPFTPTSTGMTKLFTMSATGSFPYYCAFHYPGGMFGTVFVVP